MNTTAVSSHTRNIILILGLFQGLLLLVGHFLLLWPEWALPWYAAALGAPAALQLVVIELRDRRVWLFGAGLAAVLALTGAYVGYGQTLSPSGISNVPPVIAYCITSLIGWYVLLPFVQSCFKTASWRPEYPDLFEFAWNNGITLLVAAIFTGIFWALLSLWAALFNVLGIRFFAHLFQSKYFFYPVTATVFAFALHLGRSHVAAVVTVRRIILAVFKGLLPLLAVIVLLFLAALPFIGLEPLWATGKATALMLTLQIFLIVFLNALFQDGRGEPPYSTWLRRFIQAAAVALPIYTALCVYALYLRIDQHGWSVLRFWAIVLTFVVGLHVVGYAVAALRRGGVWMAGMAPVNVGIAAVVVVLSVAVNSPLLNGQQISALSQEARLLSGKVAAAKFDFNYLRFDLGRYGNAALQRLKDIGDEHSEALEIRQAAELALAQTNRWTKIRTQTAAQARDHFSVFPKGAVLDDAFLEHVVSENAFWMLKNCLERTHRCIVLLLDLNGDKEKEYIVFHFVGERQSDAYVLLNENNKWNEVGALAAPMGFHNLEELKSRLAKGDYALAESPWRDLRIGGKLRHFRHD